MPCCWVNAMFGTLLESKKRDGMESEKKAGEKRNESRKVHLGHSNIFFFLLTFFSSYIRFSGPDVMMMSCHKTFQWGSREWREKKENRRSGSGRRLSPILMLTLILTQFFQLFSSSSILACPRVVPLFTCHGALKIHFSLLSSSFFFHIEQLCAREIFTQQCDCREYVVREHTRDNDRLMLKITSYLILFMAC